MSHRRIVRSAGLLISTALSMTPVSADEVLPDNDVIMRALSDELQRSMDLQMEDLEKPYFIQFAVEDSISRHLSASYGAITSNDRQRSREFYSEVRVGSYELDNSNFAGEGGGFFGGRGGGGGGQASLPLDDDYTAIRQSIWWATDADYKGAVETLTRKRAYMEDKTFEDRPHDFSKAEPVEHIEPGAELVFDDAAWKRNLERLSAHFKQYEIVQDSGVELMVGAGNSFVANSEGTRVRTGDAGLLLTINAEVQADDGMRLSDSRTYTGETVRDLPPVESMLKDIDDMVSGLSSLMKAPTVDAYSGPVLFDGLASAQLFRQMLAGGVAGSVDPVGTERRSFEGADSLEKQVGQRILPRSFNIHDDPTVVVFDGAPLFGHYRYDDEGVKAQRVAIVREGILEAMAMSRVPSKKFSGSNGHGRRPPGGGAAAASIGCLFIEDAEGRANDELKNELIQAAREEGLEFALRVEAVRAPTVGASRADILAFFMAMQRGRGGLGDPIHVYKVSVADGGEERVRGVEFGEITVRTLKRILAAGNKPSVYNYVGFGFGGATPASTIVAPPVLLEEVEVHKIEQEHEKPPILPAPLVRDATS